jgi:cysteine-rich repeat protein
VIYPETCDDAGSNSDNGCLDCNQVTGWACPYVVNRSICSGRGAESIFILFLLLRVSFYDLFCNCCNSHSAFLLLFSSSQSPAICGDGLILGPEECDDGVRPPSSGDGCSDVCKNESGFYCTYDAAAPKSVCARMCFGFILVFITSSCLLLDSSIFHSIHM